MKPRITSLFIFLTFFAGILLAQTAPGAGELIQSMPKLNASHLQVTEFSGGVPANTGADYYQIQYTTPDIEGVMDTASGLLIVPQRGDIDMAMTIYQRGTPGSGAAAASELMAPDAGFFGSAMAGQGMIVL